MSVPKGSAILLALGAVLLLALWLSGVVPVAGEICVENEGDGVQCTRAYLPLAVARATGNWIEAHDGLVTAIAGVFVAGFTYSLWRATNALATEARQQRAEMQSSISEAARAATAMEGVSVAAQQSAKNAADNIEMIRNRTAAQMRAYLSVTIGLATWQEREKQIRFDARPNLTNTGHTPARNVDFIAQSDVLPVPLPDDFSFPLPPAEGTGQGTLNPHQTFTIGAILKDYIDDAMVEAVKRGEGRGFYVWGVVRYDDVFGEPQRACLGLL